MDQIRDVYLGIELPSTFDFGPTKCSPGLHVLSAGIVIAAELEVTVVANVNFSVGQLRVHF